MIPREIYEETLLSYFAPIRPFLDDPQVSEVMINGPSQIYVERKGCIERVEASFVNREALVAALRNLSQYIGKAVDETNPILEGRLPDGSRVEAVLPPVSPDGPSVAIRRFARETLTIDRLVRFGAMSELVARTLEALVVAKINIFVAGGTGSGKTSLLNALSGFIPPTERVVVIEDTREVQMQRAHYVQLEARAADPRGRGAVSIRDLFRATLRLRPDRVIVGEIRGGEALDILQAMTSGHGGCMGTLHATYPRDTLTRLETMAMMSDVELPLAALRVQIGSGLQCIVQVSRLRDGSRKVTHVTEVAGYDLATQTYLLRDLFVREYQGLDTHSNVQSEIVPTGVLPTFLPQLLEHGVTLPEELTAAATLKAGSHV
ncbi:MAG: CpaF family protein [Polyangiaceae bacterium]|jgi:pilus assembly protein CpaF|nr:CpaF family protein [Polyangiaceae bacterium]